MTRSITPWIRGERMRISSSGTSLAGRRVGIASKRSGRRTTMRSRMIAALLLVPALAAGQTARRREPAAPADAASVDAIVSALYASVSHGPEASPDFDRLRGIFLYVGMLVPPKRAGEDFSVMDVDAFAERYQKGVTARKEKGTPATGFFEREIARRTDCFGNVC